MHEHVDHKKCVQVHGHCSVFIVVAQRTTSYKITTMTSNPMHVNYNIYLGYHHLFFLKT